MALVLDSSGSMKDADPQRLSVLAAQIVTDLSATGDRLSVLTMGRRGRDYVLVPMGEVQGRRERIQRDLQRVRFDGATDCEGPLREAAARLREARGSKPSSEQFVVFLSDGVCPSKGGARGLRQAAEALAADGVRIFAIGMFGEAALDERADPSADLRSMASLSGGEYFRAERAADLPRRFSEILGRIVGSEATAVERAAGAQAWTASVELDGYVWDASLIVTASAPVVVDTLTGPRGADVALPSARQPPFAARRGEVWACADSNGHDQHYAVVRITAPVAGSWSFAVDGPADARALLIQNYALDPLLELAPEGELHGVGEPIEARVWLRGRDGEKLRDPRFLEKLAVSLELHAPGEESARAIDTAAAEEGVFAARFEPASEGPHRLEARVTMRKGGLDKTSEPRSFRAFRFDLVLAPGQGPIELGSLKAGTTSAARPLDLSATEVLRNTQLELSVEGLEGLEVLPPTTLLTPAERVVELRFAADADHPGGPVAGELLVQGSGATLRVPVRVEIVPRTFWERWGELLTALGIGLLGLLVLAFVVHGIVSPHRFPAHARINYAETFARLDKNEMVIREIRGTGRGFRRNARLRIGGATSFLHSGVHWATLVVVGPQRTELVVEPGVEVRKIDRFDPGRSRVVEERPIPVQPGEIYQFGEIFVRLR